MCTYVTTNASAVCLLHYIAITNHLRPIPHLPYNYSQPILPPYAMQTKNKTKKQINDKKIQTFSYQPTPNIPHHTHTLVANCTDLGCNLSEHQGPSGLYVDRPGEQNQLRCTSPTPSPPAPCHLDHGACGWVESPGVVRPSWRSLNRWRWRSRSGRKKNKKKERK